WPAGGGAGDPAPERRLFEDGRFFHDDGRARCIVEAPRPPPEIPDHAYAFVLLTGRGSSSQWHTETRTGKSAVLRKLYCNDPYVEINPADAGALHVGADDWVVVESRRGLMRARAHLTHTVQPGHLFVPMHTARANQLTHGSFDPYSRQPAYKHCAVRIFPTAAGPEDRTPAFQSHGKKRGGRDG